MGIIDPLNDKKCLRLAHKRARQLAVIPAFVAYVKQFKTLREFKAHIRSLEQRDDLGDLDDGPRIPCEISQRLRFSPLDPNCFERTVMFLAAGEVLEPGTLRTSASLILDRGWHTFPVELIDNRPYVVVLDPISPPRNSMLATAYRARRVSPDGQLSISPRGLPRLPAMRVSRTAARNTTNMRSIRCAMH